MTGLGSGASRIVAILIKESVQMRRDRLTAAMMLVIPIVQLTIFGFAINSDPRHLPTVVYAEENTAMVRSLVQAFENSGYYQVIGKSGSIQESNRMLARGEVSFVIHIPAGFTRRLIRGERPQLLIEADASDPAASSNAIGRAQAIVDHALAHELKGTLSLRRAPPGPVQVVIHPRYNPEGITQYNIVPGLLGVILTMTCVIITSMAMTRESERGNMENLLAMPIRPHEVMIGKIAPYVLVGATQTLIILLAARFIFSVPFLGALWTLLLGVLIFIIANLSLGFTFSTIAKTQLQAMQMTFFFFLPSILLSGFMFPFAGMPTWAQWIGEALPLTHYLRIVRSIMLKGSSVSDLHYDAAAMFALMLIAMTIAVTRFRRTLD